MLKTLWTVTAAGLLALCMTGCGGSTDYASKICDKANQCGSATLVQLGVSNGADCKTTANGYISRIPANSKADADKSMDTCLAMECSPFASCILLLEKSLP
jgi:hypothetical protein